MVLFFFIFSKEVILLQALEEVIGVFKDVFVILGVLSTNSTF